MENLAAQVDAIIAARRNLLPAVQRELENANQRQGNVEQLVALLHQLRDIEKDETAIQRIDGALAGLSALLNAFAAKRDSLHTLESRFSRDTVNIGVSGEARVGKSTTLQKFSGLSDVQIPTGKGLPVTAVRSEIFNDPAERAEVTFRDQQSFLSEYIRPLLDTVNQHLDQPLIINSLNGLRTAKFPEVLGSNVNSVASDSLARLRDAQLSLATYESLLTGGVKQVPLGDLRSYVAYPSMTDIAEQQRSGIPANRAYIAVKSVKIFCAFPALEGVKIGLVDLPGLGEIDGSVADLHLQGLEDGVDLIFPIMRPTDAEGFAKQGISSNIDHLRRIQPGIKRRGDLITAGINVTEGLEETVESLKVDFNRVVNSANSDPIEIEEFNAIDDASVARLFHNLLRRIGERLPYMDQEVFAHALANNAGDAEVRGTLAALNETLTQLLRLIPIPQKILHQQINAIARELIQGYNQFEIEQQDQADEHSQWYRDFDEDVARIHGETKALIDDGFFLGQARWEESARGHGDYYGWYRDEAQRLRREIIAQYAGLDVFYDDHVTAFKNDIIDIFFENTGQLNQKFEIDFETAGATHNPDSVISSMLTEFAGTIQDDDLDSALRLLQDVRFSFRNNVFLQISRHLEELANPSEDFQIGFGKHPEWENIRVELGKVGNFNRQLNKLHMYLQRITHEANNRIRESLLQHDDRFHEYLSVSMSFFNDFLYRKDEENFKYVVVNGLINEYRDYILGNDTGVSIDINKKTLIDQIKALIEDVNGGPTAHRATVPPKTSAPNMTGYQSGVQTPPRRQNRERPVNNTESNPVVIQAVHRSAENPPPKGQTAPKSGLNLRDALRRSREPQSASDAKLRLLAEKPWETPLPGQN